jgi:hypothetical protein
MAKNNIEASRTITGVFTDLHPMNMGEGQYAYALNARIENFDGNGIPMVQNEPSNLLCAKFPDGYKSVGFVNIIEQERIIWFLYNADTSDSAIAETRNIADCRQNARNGILKGACDDCATINLTESTPLEKITQQPCCTYSAIATDECLNFSREFPVNAVEYRLINCGIEIFFTDGSDNGRRRIVFEYIDGNVTDYLKIRQDFYEIIGFETPPCDTPIYGPNLDCNKLRVQPNMTTPCIDFIDLVSGGNNKAGVYQFFIAFSDEKGNKLSSYVSSTNPIPIRTKDVTFETDYITDKAISLRIENLDPAGPFQFYKLAVAKTINSFTEYTEVGVFPVTQTKYAYTGHNKAEVKLTVDDIFQRVPYYKSAGHVTSSNNILYWAAVKEYPKLNLQRVANRIKLYWQTIAVPEPVYRNPRNVNKFRACMRDEVYPYGVQFIFDYGEDPTVYHIPGREAIESDTELVTTADAIKENNCVDCTDPVEGDTQLEIEILNTVSCSGSEGSLDLVIDNSVQASACPLTPHTDTGCTPTTTTGTPPTVSAGANRTITYLGPVGLTGIVTAGDSPIAGIGWTQLSGPNTVDIDNSGVAVTFFTNYNPGVYVFQLCAIDANGNVVTNDVAFTMDIPVNEAPVSDPGADKTVILPITTSYLNGSGSTDAEGISTYAWSQDSGPNTATITSPTDIYTSISGLIEGVYVFRLVVTDPRGCESEATTIIYVLPDPATVPPTCTSLLYPVNGSVTSSFNTVVLDWNDIVNATSYDVYLDDGGGFSFEGNVTVSNFTLTGLDPNTIYNWYVVPKNAAGSATGCDACYRSFVTPTESSVNACEKQRWEVYNTATLEGGALEVYKDCEETCYQSGNFAYWQSTEKYPTNPEIWGELCGQAIRHHKFPDSLVTHIHDNQNGVLDNTVNNIIYPIGVKVDTDSVRTAIADMVTDGVILQADADRIVGYRIVRGNRFQNKSVVAKGLLFDMNQYRRKLNGTYFDNQDIFFANYPYNDLRSNPFITDDFRNYDEHNHEKGADLPFISSKRYTFHSPDTHFSEPSIGTKLKLETVEYGLSEGYYTKSKKQARQRFLSNTAYSIAFTGGITAALLKTEEKEIREYTATGSIISGMGVASGELGPFLPYAVGPGAAFLVNSGIDAIVNPFNSAEIFSANQVKARTVQGKYNDWVNPVYLAKKKPILLPLFPLMLVNYAANFLTIVIQEANIIIDLIESLTPFRDWTVQYHSVGKYNAYTPVLNSGNKIRSIDSSAYLKSENSLVSEPSGTPDQFVNTKINNWNRESSVYLRYIGDEVPNAGTVSGIEDQSRFTLEDNGCDLDKRRTAQISSYYASIKNFVPDQYGSIYNIDYVPTDSCTFDINASNEECRTVFGGDTFINRFGLKIKVPYFLADTFMLPDGTDFDFELYANLAVPRHYYNSTLGVGSEFDSILDIFTLFTPEGIGNFLGRPKSIRDCDTSKFFYQNGFIYLYHYGIPYFLVESDVNVDYRHAENLQEKAYYPLQSDLDYWLQQENVPISEDNTYIYNRDYSKQNHETPMVIDGPFTVNGAAFEPGRECDFDHPERIIYSPDANWLTYRTNDFFDFSLKKGRIVSIEGIEDDAVLVRFINGTSIFKSILRVPVNGQTVQVGNGGVFSNPPQSFAETKLGYIGTQHKAILHTEFGHVWPDAKRGQIFNIAPGASGVEEISKAGMENWFKENLPFQLLRDFSTLPEEDIDNNFLGMGITMAFDKRNSRMFITKLDYKLKDSSVTYNAATKQFKKGTDVVTLGDKRYFTDKSWTWTYNFKTKSWTSPYSIKPNYYIEFVDFFGAGRPEDLWLHNLTNSSFQVFFGELHPFIFEPILKFDGTLKVLNCVEFDTEVRRYDNEFDYTLKKSIAGVNKAVVYNDMYSSGLLNLVKTNKNNLADFGKYPIRNLDSWNIEVSLSNYKWRFNQFFNTVRDASEIPLWKFKGNNFEKDLNNQAFNYKKNDFDLARLKGQWFKIMLINDQLSNYKIMHKFIDEFIKTSLDNYNKQLFGNYDDQTGYFEDMTPQDEGVSEGVNDVEDATDTSNEPSEEDMYNSVFPEDGIIGIGAGAARQGMPTNRPGSRPGFRSFNTYQEGKQALLDQLRLYQTGKSKTGIKPDTTLLGAMSIYAPSSDGNNPKHYAEVVAKQVGVDINTPISKIDTEKWAAAIERMEGNKVGNNPGNLRKQAGGNIARTKQQQYTGLNDESMDQLILPLEGENTIRGLDSYQPVLVEDDFGARQILRGPRHTMKTVGNVYEKRLK